MTLDNLGQKIILVSEDTEIKNLLVPFLHDKCQLTYIEDFDGCIEILNNRENSFFDCILLDIPKNFNIKNIFPTYQLLLKSSTAVGYNAVIILVDPPDTNKFEPEELSFIRRELLETVNGVQEVFFKDNLINKLAGLNRCIRDAISRNTSRKKSKLYPENNQSLIPREDKKDTAINRLLSKYTDH